MCVSLGQQQHQKRVFFFLRYFYLETNFDFRFQWTGEEEGGAAVGARRRRRRPRKTFGNSSSSLSLSTRPPSSTILLTLSGFIPLYWILMEISNSPRSRRRRRRIQQTQLYKAGTHNFQLKKLLAHKPRHTQGTSIRTLLLSLSSPPLLAVAKCVITRNWIETSFAKYEARKSCPSSGCLSVWVTFWHSLSTSCCSSAFIRLLLQETARTWPRRS